MIIDTLRTIVNDIKAWQADESRVTGIDEMLEIKEKLESLMDQVVYCEEKQCTYYNHYLVHHDPEKHGPRMEHEAFHQAEKNCEVAQKRVQDWLDANETGQPPESIVRQAEFWEMKVCA